MGMVAEKVVRAAPCPVLTVRRPRRGSVTALGIARAEANPWDEERLVDELEDAQGHLHHIA